MKILTVSWYVFTENNGEFHIASNGGSIMIANIAEYIGRKEESYLFQGSISIPSMQYGNIKVVGTNEFVPEKRSEDNIDIWQKNLAVAFRNEILVGNYDFVFAHGGGEFCDNVIDICRELNQEVAFVCHLFFRSSIFAIKDLNMVVVGTKMKEDIVEDYPGINRDQISVILNGVPIKENNEKKKKYKDVLFPGKKVLLCAASLQPRKNQIQLIRAFSLVPQVIRDRIQLVLCGRDSAKSPMMGKIREEIAKYRLEENVSYIGVVPENEMPIYNMRSDGLVLPSLHEGLSLSVIEEIRYGKPVIMFADNETAYDINDSKVSVLAPHHTDQALADALLTWYETKWDEDYIKNYSIHFTMERVADDYITYCKERLAFKQFK